MANRVQISTDGLECLRGSHRAVLWGDADYGQIIKIYGHEYVEGQRRYSQPEFVSPKRRSLPAARRRPDFYQLRRAAECYDAPSHAPLDPVTLAFSKKRENFEAAVGLHFAYYNFVKRHNTLRCTPAMAAGVHPSFGR